MEKVKNNFIGLRTIKTLIAVIISVLIMKYIFNDTPFFACIGAVASMEKTIASSFKMAIIRNVGTIIGGVIGIITTYLTDNIVLLTFGLIPMIYIKNLIGKKDSIVPGAIVYFAVVYLNTNSSSFSYGMRRIFGTLVGSVIAILINYIIFKPKNEI